MVNLSKGEKQISEILNKNGITYITEKKFNGCEHINSLRFDFYLTEYNMCIEYDGQQHFQPVKIFGGENKLKLQKKLDSIKNKYCEENNIYLIRIPYYDYNNIEDIIKEKNIKQIT